MKKIAVFCFGLLLLSCNVHKNGAKDNAVLDGTWELEYITGPRIAFEGLYPNGKPFLVISTKEHRASGKNSCNSYSGNYTLNGAQLNFGTNKMITTEMLCQGIGEKTYMNTLGKITSFSVSDDGKQLKLYDDAIETMRFHKK